MIPIKLPNSNITYAKDQPEYLPLPAHRTEDGIVTTAWRLDWKERIKVLFGGKIYFRTMTFNQPLQPQLPSVDNPILLRKSRLKNTKKGSAADAKIFKIPE